MFDLNLTVDCNGKAEFTADHLEAEAEEEEQEQSPATSVSSLVNGETSSSNDDTCSPRAGTFNFDIVDRSSDPGGGDRGLTLGLVTRELFPVSPPFDHGPTRVGVQPPQQQAPQVQPRKSRRGPRSRSSQYRGVTFYRRTGRWESHIWDCGKQVYLGGFDTALAAARAYDRAAIKFRGVGADINFNLTDYDEDMKQTKNLSKEEFVHILRRQSTGFSRGSSKYRGVTLHKCGRWEARMGQFLGKKAYDKAAIKCNGRDAVTNFESSAYDGEMILEPCNEAGSKNDLDLNLGISTSSPKESGNLGSFHFHPYDVQNARLLKLQGVPVKSEHPVLLPGLNPQLAPNYEERGAKERPELVSSQEVAKWGWQMPDQVHPTQIATLTAAASSGFSLPANPSRPLSNSDSSYPMVLDLCFSSYPPTSANAPQYHSHFTK